MSRQTSTSSIWALSFGEYDGWYESGPVPTIALSGWPEDLVEEVPSNYFEEHREIFRLLGVSHQLLDDGFVRCQFTEDSARAYQRTHIFLHELGHHHHRITHGGKRDRVGSEKFAEDYALLWQRRIWQKYREQFRFYPQPAAAVEVDLSDARRSDHPKRRKAAR